MRLTVICNGSKRTIFASGGHELLHSWTLFDFKLRSWKNRTFDRLTIFYVLFYIESKMSFSLGFMALLWFVRKKKDSSFVAFGTRWQRESVVYRWIVDWWNSWHCFVFLFFFFLSCPIWVLILLFIFFPLVPKVQKNCSLRHLSSS